MESLWKNLWKPYGNHVAKYSASADLRRVFYRVTPYVPQIPPTPGPIQRRLRQPADYHAVIVGRPNKGRERTKKATQEWWSPDTPPQPPSQSLSGTSDGVSHVSPLSVHHCLSIRPPMDLVVVARHLPGADRCREISRKKPVSWVGSTSPPRHHGPLEGTWRHRAPHTTTM